MGLAKTPVVLPTMLSPLGKACAGMDLAAVHDILLKTGYKDEEGADREVSFFHFLAAMHQSMRGPNGIEKEKDSLQNNWNQPSISKIGF